MTPPKQQAFAVALVHGDGPIFLAAQIAPSDAEATAIAVSGHYRNGIPDQHLTGVAVLPLSLEWLRTAVKAMETGEPGKVFELVPGRGTGAVQELPIPDPSGLIQAGWHPSGQGPDAAE